VVVLVLGAVEGHACEGRDARLASLSSNAVCWLCLFLVDGV
jgi:hypothetical protein